MKGQISFDYMVTLIFALILIQTLIGFSDNFLLNQDKISIRLQEKQIGNAINSVLTYSQFLKQDPKAYTYEVNHNIPKINVSANPGVGLSVPIECEIAINAVNITITVSETHYSNLSTGETVTVVIPNTSGITSAVNGCGQTLQVTGSNP